MFHRIHNSSVCIFLILYDFISILQVHCLMRPERQDLNVNFFTFRFYRQLDGRQAPIFKNFPIQHIFLKFCFLKYKNKKSARNRATMLRPICSSRPFLKKEKRLQPNLIWSVTTHQQEQIAAALLPACSLKMVCLLFKGINCFKS